MDDDIRHSCRLWATLPLLLLDLALPLVAAPVMFYLFMHPCPPSFGYLLAPSKAATTI